MAPVTDFFARRRFQWFLALALGVLGLFGCGEPGEHETPATPPEIVDTTPKQFNFDGALQQLKDIDAAVSASDVHKAKSLMAAFTSAIPTSFPLSIPTPFATHSFHDALMKISKALAKGQQTALIEDWDNVLQRVHDKKLVNDQKTITLTMTISRSVLKGNEPTLTTTLHEDFTALSKDDLNERQSITQESFWQDAFLYSGDRGRNAKLDTGIVTVRHESQLVAILEFKNHLVTVKPIDLSKQSDLMNVVPKTPGYVSSVGRRAAYARFDLGRKMFDEFFTYARNHGLAQSFLHVRATNRSAIALYENVGYKEVAQIPNYYSSPSEDAIVMRKIF